MSELSTYLLRDFPLSVSDRLSARLDSSEVQRRFQSPQALKWADALDRLRLGDMEPEVCFETLKSWRKGPYNAGGVMIDSEWDCSQKWARIEPLLGDLSGKSVLDIGCNSGYFMFELVNRHPEWVLGIDPASIYWFQFQAIQHFYQRANLAFLPLGFDALPDIGQSYDLMLCMGILYHHPEPEVLLALLRQYLRPSGSIILETLVLDGEKDCVLVPEARYAKMKNVYAIPSVSQLVAWCRASGFATVHVQDVSRTTSDEQRVTPWGPGASLADFLDPDDHLLTIEGHPAPVRAVLQLKI